MEIIFETERLYLRKFTMDDSELLFSLNNNPEVLKYLHEPPPVLEKMKSVLADIILPQYHLYNHGRWAVHLKTDNEFIGWCGLKYVKERDEIDLGYRFFEQYWGKGFATESAKATVKYGFEQLRLDRIMAQAHVDNIASQNVIEKCGLQFYQNSFSDGCNVKQYEIFKEKYYHVLHNNKN